MAVSAHVGSVELDEFCGGDDAVEDGFGDDGVVQGSVPVFGVELAGDDGGSAAFSGGEDVEQLGGGVTGDRVVRKSSRTSSSQVCTPVRNANRWASWRW